MVIDDFWSCFRCLVVVLVVSIVFVLISIYLQEDLSVDCLDDLSNCLVYYWFLICIYFFCFSYENREKEKIGV